MNKVPWPAKKKSLQHFYVLKAGQNKNHPNDVFSWENKYGLLPLIVAANAEINQSLTLLTLGEGGFWPLSDIPKWLF